MVTFALVAEGITDHVAVEKILIAHYSDNDNDIDVNYLQPLRDATDEARQGDFGGWEKVLEYCSRTELQDALQVNDFVVIQIDTDQADHVNFNVGLTVGGEDKKVEVLIQEVREFIIGKIGADIYQEYSNRFLFAICVHSLECWLVPAFKTYKTEKKLNCEKVLLQKLGTTSEKLKKYESYKDLFNGVLKSKGLRFLSSQSSSLGVFLNSLPRLTDQ